MFKFLHTVLGNLWSQRFAFWCMGLEIEPRMSKKSEMKAGYRQIMRYWIISIVMILATSCELCSVIAFIVQNRSDIVLCSEALMHGIQMISSILKMLIFLYKCPDLVSLIADTQKHFEKVLLDLNTWNEQNRRGQLLCGIYLMMCFGTSISFLVVPVVMTGWRYYSTGQFQPETSFLVVLPYDVTQPWFYLLDCCLMAIVLTFFCCSTSGVDTLYGWFVFNLTTHYRHLMQQLKRIVDQRWTGSNMVCDLKMLVLEHAQMLELLNRFEDAFREIACVEVLLMCVLYCSVSCQYIMPHTQQNFAFLFLFSLVISIQLCIYCLGAEQIREEAEHFSNELYQLLPWDEFAPRQRKLLVLPLQRAQKDLELNAYFFVLGRPLLVWTFRMAGSFTALLNALRDQYEGV